MPALVGLDEALQAMLLLAVEPRLQGIVMAAAAGTGKSSLARGMRLLLQQDDSPFLEIPTSVDIENLLGGMDLEMTLATGKIVLQQGILARAHKGVITIDGLNLLSDSAVNLLLSVIDQKQVVFEREGISLKSPSQFNLIGSYDPAEGQPRRHLLDRVGLLITLPAQFHVSPRMDILRNNLLPALKEWDEELEFMRGIVQAAREQLPNVAISSKQVRQLALLALKYGVEGHRVDLFATRTACAAAALSFKEAVDDEDLLIAARLVILPRATQQPLEDEPPPPSPQPETPQEESSDEEQEAETVSTPTDIIPLEQLFEVLESELPEDLEKLTFGKVRRGRTGSRGATDGKRGRHIGSITGDPRRDPIDLVATLRSAAPWQRMRAAQNEDQDRLIHLRKSDIRVKQYRSKAGALFCFAVDASGSMAMHRMRQAKGAVQTLLQKAYVNRDRVALISFRGESAELLLPPTQSVELARRSLDFMRTGGGTPLASALLLAHDVSKQAASRGILQTVLIVLTDGRANISLRSEGDVKEELQRIGSFIAASPLKIVIVDTQRSYLSRGEARKLVEWVGGEYVYLPNVVSESIADLAFQAINN